MVSAIHYCKASSWTYSCGQLVGIGAIVATDAKNTASKNHPKDILCDKNHFYAIVQVRMLHLKQENISRWLDIDFF